MPELQEVETASQGVRDHTQGQRILQQTLEPALHPIDDPSWTSDRRSP